MSGQTGVCVYAVNELKSPSPVTDSMEFLREEVGEAQARSLNIIEHNPARGRGQTLPVQYPFSL